MSDACQFISEKRQEISALRRRSRWLKFSGFVIIILTALTAILAWLQITLPFLYYGRGWQWPRLLYEWFTDTIPTVWYLISKLSIPKSKPQDDPIPWLIAVVFYFALLSIGATLRFRAVRLQGSRFRGQELLICRSRYCCK